MEKSLNVYLWNVKVGTLSESGRGNTAFHFEPEFLNRQWNIAPFVASIYSTRIRNGLPVFGDKDKLYNGLPPFLADSLPDNWGNAVFKEWTVRNRIRNKDITPIDKLAYMGTRSMGALEFLPPMMKELEEPFSVEIDSLFQLAKETLESAEHIHETQDENLVYETLFRVGTSAGGKRPKAIIHVNERTREIISGQVSCPMEFTPYILKFDEKQRFPSTKVEFSYYLMTKDIGIDMMPCTLVHSKDSCHFMTQRFDRANGEKIHTQTLAAIRPESDCYEDLFQTAFELRIGKQEIKELFRRMAFNVYGGNVDDHNKNFSFRMDKSGEWHITPAYDMTFTVDVEQLRCMNRHAMSVNMSDDEITDADMLAIATRYDVKGANEILEKTKSVLANYRQYARDASVGTDWGEKIQKEIDKRIETAISGTRSRGRKW